MSDHDLAAAREWLDSELVIAKSIRGNEAMEKSLVALLAREKEPLVALLREAQAYVEEYECERQSLAVVGLLARIDKLLAGAS